MGKSLDGRCSRARRFDGALSPTSTRERAEGDALLDWYFIVNLLCKAMKEEALPVLVR